jgi:hypothetical protein
MSDPKTPSYPIVMAKCRRGSDQLTSGQSCKSTSCYSINPQGSSVSIFKCVTCNFIWSVPVGGAFNY